MLPPSGPPSKPQLLARRRQTVLDEEEYVSILSAIIERDYFPHLAAAVRGGHGSSRSSNNNESGFDSTVSVSDALVRDLSVDSFFKQFTSYDNDSFEDLQQQSVEEHRRKYHWLYEDGISSDSKKGMMMLYHIGDKILTEDERKKMDYILDNGVFGTDDSGLGFGAPVVADCRPNRTDPWRFRVRNQLMFPPELRDSEDTCGMHDHFPVGSAVDHHHSMLKSILPSSDNLTSNLQITAGTVGGQLQQNMKDALHFAVSTYNRRVGEASRAEKVIQRHNTSIDHDQLLLRLVTDGTTCSSSRFLPMLELPHTPSLFSSAPSEADSCSSSVGDRKKKKQYRPVPMSPYIEPGQGPMGAVSPLYTWGTIEGPPIPLLHDDALISSMQGSRQVSDQYRLKRLQQEAYSDQVNGVPYFSVQRISQREAIARSMDTSNQQKKAKLARSSHRLPQEVGDTDSVVGRSNYYTSSENNSSVRSSRSAHGSVARRFHSLTPAAQALAIKLQSKNKPSSKGRSSFS